MNRIAFCGFIFLLAHSVYSQTYTSINNQAGEWYAGTTWVSEVSPGNCPNAADINVYGYVRVESGGLLICNSSPTINIYDTLYIDGNFDLSQGNLVVAAGGVLVVDGNFNAQNGLNLLTNNGNIVVTGNLNVTNGHIVNNANFYVYESTVVNGGGRINGCDGFGNPSGCSPITSGNIGDEDDLLADNPDRFDFVASNGITPVTLLQFSGQQNMRSEIELKWSTATEFNFDRFVVQRSSSGGEFEEIISIKGAGFSMVRNDYTYLDPDAPIGRLYYRLTAVDYDGTFETFPIISINNKGEQKIEFYPNPVQQNESLTIELNFTPEPGDYFRLIALDGSELNSVPVKSPKTNLSLPVSGSYVLQYVSSGVRSNTRVIVD